jgi:hypothetical protein
LITVCVAVGVHIAFYIYTCIWILLLCEQITPKLLKREKVVSEQRVENKVKDRKVSLTPTSLYIDVCKNCVA